MQMAYKTKMYTFSFHIDNNTPPRMRNLFVIRFGRHTSSDFAPFTGSIPKGESASPALLKLFTYKSPYPDITNRPPLTMGPYSCLTSVFCADVPNRAHVNEIRTKRGLRTGGK